MTLTVCDIDAILRSKHATVKAHNKFQTDDVGLAN
jgi:hypothetical protein